MTSQALQGKYGQPLGLDLCFACGVAWFDGYESLLLAPGAILALFTAIHEHRAEQQRRPLGSPACPRCRMTLVETHDTPELEHVLALGIVPDLLGINNRNILVGETDDGDVSLTEGLAAAVPAGWLVLSESGIRGPADARRARSAGADALLVGTAILTAADPGEAIDGLVGIGWPA